MIYISNLVLVSVVLIISNGIGNFFVKKLNVDWNLSNELLGFSVWMGSLFIFGFFLLKLQVSGEIFHGFFLLVTLMLFIPTINYIKFDFSIKELSYLISTVIVFIFVSSRHTLGEQMGDNVFLFNLVTKNINPEFINNFYIDTGKVLDFIGINNEKAYLTYYHFYSFLLHYYDKITSVFNLSTPPAYVLNLWTGNILFYIFSTVSIINFIRYFQITQKNLITIIILFIGFYIGSYYYNIDLGFYGVTALVFFISNLLFIIMHYNSKQNSKLIILIFFSIYSLLATGSTGFIVSIYILFSFFILQILKNNENVYYYISLLLIPIAHYTLIIDNILPSKIIFISLMVLAILSFLVGYIKPINKMVSQNIKFILLGLWILLILFSFISIDQFFDKTIAFFEVKTNFDRVQDYFTFNTLNQNILNIFHYLLILSLLFNKNTRDIGIMVGIILAFFINPLVYPLLSEKLQWIYNRAYVSVFNPLILSVGLFALFNILDQKLMIKSKWIKSLLIILLLPFTVMQLTDYFHPIYIPTSDFNPVYKLNNEQIEILEVLREKIEIEGYSNPKVISQIYGTSMYVPEIDFMYFNVAQRRIYDINSSYEDLYNIFFVPVFKGDDGPRFNANYNLTCYLIMEVNIDFVIYDKELSVYDDTTQNWIPIHWYARDCAEKVIENDRYIMYRFYWEH